MRTRTPAAVLLCALLSASAYTQPPKDQPPKDPLKDVPKDKEKGRTDPETRYKWPTEIAGKNLAAWLKDVTDSDPAVREFALKTLPNFGPENVREHAGAGKLLANRLRFTSDGGEPDPGVRLTLFNTVAIVGFKDVRDEKEALRILGVTVDQAPSGELRRLQAVQTLALFGPKAEDQVTRLTGVALRDPAYETRRSIANALARIGFDERKGPNIAALRALAGTLSGDVSASVRMEALQSLVILGPPWAAPLAPGGKGPPQINQQAADYVADAMRVRLGMPPGKAGPPPIGKVVPPKKLVPLEKDKQLEIWCRVVLMRFDPTEINNANLAAIGEHIKDVELGPRLQALQALALFGEKSAPEIQVVVVALDDPDPLVVNTTLNTLAQMGVEANGAVPVLEKLEKKWAGLRETKMKENLKNKQFLEAFTKLEPKEKEQVIANLPEEQVRKGIEDAIAWIKKSKPGMPGGDPPPAPEPMKKP
jgi:HEAT repeat protein